jgi:hypothetical protein
MTGQWPLGADGRAEGSPEARDNCGRAAKIVRQRTADSRAAAWCGLPPEEFASSYEIGLELGTTMKAVGVAVARRSPVAQRRRLRHSAAGAGSHRSLVVATPVPAQRVGPALFPSLITGLAGGGLISRARLADREVR